MTMPSKKYSEGSTEMEIAIIRIEKILILEEKYLVLKRRNCIHFVQTMFQRRLIKTTYYSLKRYLRRSMAITE